MIRTLLLSMLALAFCVAAAPETRAQDAPEKIEIKARTALEWDRKNQKYTALGDAAARQGESAIRADRLTAYYRSSESRDIDIRTMTAEGNVRIEAARATAFGDKARYDVASGYAVMTGHALKMETPDQKITAKEAFEYQVNEGRLVARGQAVVYHGGNRLESDEITAWFTEDAQGNRVLDRAEAAGNVVITTAEEVVTGEKGTYDRKTGMATLSGGVKIVRGPNILEGARAEVDLNTEISRIFGAGRNAPEGKAGRVRGVFFTNDTKNSPSGQ